MIVSSLKRCVISRLRSIFRDCTVLSNMGVMIAARTFWAGWQLEAVVTVPQAGRPPPASSPDDGPWVLAGSVYGRPRVFADVTEANDRRWPSRTHSEISSKWWVSLTRRTQIFPSTMSISLTQQGFCAMRQ